MGVPILNLHTRRGSLDEKKGNTIPRQRPSRALKPTIPILCGQGSTGRIVSFYFQMTKRGGPIAADLSQRPAPEIRIHAMVDVMNAGWRNEPRTVLSCPL